MKRIAKILSFVCLVCVIGGGIQLSKRLPTDTRSFVQKKYAGWNGVLRGWVYSDWSCAGSFISWLNSCAAEFEKAHEGVYLEFEAVSREAIASNDIHPPDMRIFSEGAVPSEATPVAMGGYIIAENASAPGAAIPPDYSAAAIAMYGENDDTIELPDGGVDLGLPVMSSIEPIDIDEDAFRRFCNGELGRTIVNQRELAHLIALRNSGRGPDWKCTVQGQYAWCDQRLMLQICVGGEQQALCEAFREMLLSDECQRALSKIGAFPVTDIQAYSEPSAYRPMEQQLHAGRRLFPKTEHSAEEFAALVRKLYTGEISHSEAVSALQQTCR